MSPYLAPIALHYPGGILHSEPGGYLDRLMVPHFTAMTRVALLNLPGAPTFGSGGRLSLWERGLRFALLL